MCIYVLNDAVSYSRNYLINGLEGINYPILYLRVCMGWGVTRKSIYNCI